jgi:hypothetical protein
MKEPAGRKAVFGNFQNKMTIQSSILKCVWAYPDPSCTGNWAAREKKGIR